MSKQPMAFGPWSSSLDNGTWLELSAFWRRRMAGLTRLPLGQQLRRRWMAVGAIAALLVVATPLVEFSPLAVGDEPETAAEAAAEKSLVEKAERQKFVWKFSNGMEVELIGLAKNPSKGETWWRPDGSPLKDASLPAAKFRTDGKLAREIAFRWRHTPEGDQTRQWVPVPHYDGAGGSVTVKEPDGSEVEVEGVAFSGDAKDVMIRITASVAATPWKTLFDSDGKHASSAGALVDGRQRGMAFAIANETKSGTAITATYSLDGDPGRVIAVDKQGKEHVASRVNQVGSMGFMQGTFEFDKLPVDEIERFELQMQSRKLETVEFRNVSLDAGHETKVLMTSRNTAQKKAGAEPAQKVLFGAVIELTINDAEGRKKDSLVDLETGKLHSMPEGLEEKAAVAWIESRGIDVMGLPRGGVQGLIGFDMIAVPGVWDEEGADLKTLDFGKPGTPTIMPGIAKNSTYYIQTCDGTRGMLQIVDVVEDETVKIRYKLAKE